MNTLDRLRIERAVLSYSFWLDTRNVSGRRRRDLRRELRANLLDASADSGVKAAIAGLGSTRRMAAEVPGPDAHRPLWVQGVVAGMFAFAIVTCVELFAAAMWVQGVVAASPTSRVSGEILPWLTVQVVPDTAGEGSSHSISFGWVPLAIGLFVFALASRPWRLFSSSTEAVSTNR